VPSYALVLAGRGDAIFADDADQDAFGGPGRWGWINRIDHDIASLTASWAILWTIRGYERRIASIRDELVALGLRRPRRSVKALQIAERDLMRTSGDSVPIASDIAAQREGLQRSFRVHGDLDFHEVRSEPGQESLSWTDELLEWIDTRGSRLAAITRDVRSLQSSLGAALTARTNLSLQRRIEILTWVVGIVTIATLVVTMVAQRADLDPLWDVFR
jgi:hypothetical protein